MGRPVVNFSPTNPAGWTFFLSYEYDTIRFKNGALIMTKAVGMSMPTRTYGWNPAEPKTVLIPLHAIQYAEFENHPNDVAIPDSLLYYGDHS